MLSKTIYSVVDIETTGGKSSNNRITEIAIVKTDGEKILDIFSTLVNPHRKIDKFVVQLTGITDKMVSSAPDFKEVINKIDEFTKDTIFVAHNVAFDYTIVKREYRLVKKIFKRNTLCTVILSRKILKDQESYSLGKLSKNLGIHLKNRHRALGDAEATAHVLHHIIKIIGVEKVLDFSSNNNHIIEFKGEITSDIIEELPEDSGTFRFLNKKGEVLYIGYAKNIFSSVTKFLIQEAKLNTHHGLFENMFSIDFEVFNSFLITQLNAISEINKYKPRYNKSKTYRDLPIGVYEKEKDLLKGPFLSEYNKKDKALWRFSNMKSSKRFLKRILKSKELLAPTYTGNVDEFDTRYKKIIELYLKSELYPSRNFFIFREVSYQNIAYIVWIKDFIYQGYGKVEMEFFDQKIDSLKECITIQKSTQEIQKILKKYIAKARGIKIIKY